MNLAGDDPEPAIVVPGCTSPPFVRWVMMNGWSSGSVLTHRRAGAHSLVTSTTVLRMSSDLLRRIGTALYGEHWPSELARDLGVPRRTVQRWEAGDAPIPLTLRRDLARLVAMRQDVLGKLYRELTSG